MSDTPPVAGFYTSDGRCLSVVRTAQCSPAAAKVMARLYAEQQCDRRIYIVGLRTHIPTDLSRDQMQRARRMMVVADEFVLPFSRRPVRS